MDSKEEVKEDSFVKIIHTLTHRSDLNDRISCDSSKVPQNSSSAVLEPDDLKTQPGAWF